MSAAWAAVYVLLTEGCVPLVQRCCAVWACHALRSFGGPAVDRAALHQACRIAYRHACGRTKGVDLDTARRRATAIAEASSGPAFHAAAAVARTCTRTMLPIRTGDPARSLLVPAVFDVPWLAALAGDAHAAWAAYRRHLLRAVRAAAEVT